MSETDDQAWLEALAGRRSPGEGPAAREASRLREAILEHLGAEQVDAPRDDPERVAALIERARDQGLLAPRTRHRTSMLPIGIAATIVCLAAAIALWSGLRSRPLEVQRSAGDGVVHLQSSDPSQLKQQLIRELQSAGVSARGYESFGVQGIDADLPRPTPPQVQQILRKHGVPTPADGVLRVEIDAQSQK